MGRPADALCLSFCERGVWTWNLLKAGFVTGIIPSEDTFTDVNLLELQRKHPIEIWTRRFNPRVEKWIGADWDWWLGAPSGWLRLRVQAKKLNLTSRTYDELEYPNGSGKQLSTLIKSATIGGFAPMYCFYNYWDHNVSVQWNCGTYSSKSQELQGCMIASADHVKSCISAGLNDLPSIAKRALPCNCLVCCEGYSSRTADLTQRATGLLRKFWNLTPEVVTEPPPYVKAIMEGRQFEEPPHDVLRVFIVKQGGRGAA